MSGESILARNAETDISFEPEKLGHECGLFAVIRNNGIRQNIDYYEAIATLRHRGPNGFGIFASHLDRSFLGTGGTSDHELLGLLEKQMSIIENPTFLIGHSRYGTSGNYEKANLQPIQVTNKSGATFTIAHNGNIVGLNQHNDTYSDTYRFAKLFEESEGESDEIIQDLINKTQGAFSLIIHCQDTKGQRIYASRDRDGIRPLIIGKTNSGDIALASESITFDKAGIGEIIREVNRGEIIAIEHSKDGSPIIREIQQGEEGFKAMCSFEHVYFQRPESKIPISGVDPKYWPTVAGFRKKCGEVMAEKFLKNKYLDEDTIISPIPDSGRMLAEGLVRSLGRQLMEIYIRDHNSQAGKARSFLGDNNLNQIPTVVSGKMTLTINELELLNRDIILVDDSIVRGNSAKVLVSKLKELGVEPKRIKMAFGFPQVMYGCHLGVSMREKDGLIAARHGGDPSKIAEELGIAEVIFADEGVINDGLRHSVRNLLEIAMKKGEIDEHYVEKAMARLEEQIYCFGCHNGNYPVENIIPINSIK